jgi:hypothetical protein
MTAKRNPLNRRRRAFDPETIRLFAQLEATPMSRRHSAAFKEDEERLARRLGLNFERKFLGIHVLDRTRTCRWAPTLAGHDTWHDCQRLRRELLEASGLGGKAASPAPRQ